MVCEQILNAYYRDCLKFWKKEKEKGFESELNPEELALKDIRMIITNPYSPKGEPLDMTVKRLWIEKKEDEINKKHTFNNII